MAETGSNIYLGKRWFAGQVARAGESGIVAASFINNDAQSIPAGIFVAHGDKAGTCRRITADSDNVLGVVIALGVTHEFKPGKNLSAMALPHGSEVVVKVADGAVVALGDTVKIIATGNDAGAIGDKGTIETHYFVVDVNASLAKIKRREVVAPTAAPAQKTANKG